MNRPANPNKVAADIIRSAASVASGHGELGLANRLWAFEARLRQEGRDRLERETSASKFKHNEGS